jgi:Zn-dependent protease
LCFFALTLHELGHILTAYFLDEKISMLKILPFGFSCKLKNQSQILKNQMLKILIAGPAVSFITAGLVFYWTSEFAVINFLIGMFNLMPIFELDGMRMASILIKLGFITDRGLDSLLLLKDEAKKRLPVNVGFISAKLQTDEDEQDQVSRMQREIARLEGRIAGLEFAIRCNGVSGAEVGK